MTSSACSFGTETYRVLPGSAAVGLNVMRFTVRSAFIAPRVFTEWLGRRFACTAIVCIYLCFQIYKYISHKMTEPWEIDPTEPDRDGAGAAGGAAGGDFAGDITLPPPLQPPQDIDRTNPFEPTGGTSTPYPPPDDAGETNELSNMNLDEWELDTDDIPIVTEVDYVDADERTRLIEKGKRFIKDQFPNVDFKKLGPIGLGKKPENKYRLVRYGAKGGEDTIFKKDNSGLLKSFIDRAKGALGKSSEEIIAENTQEERELRQRLAGDEKQLKEYEQMISLEQKTTENVQNLKRRIEQTIARREALEEEHGLPQEKLKEIDRLKQLEKKS